MEVTRSPPFPEWLSEYVDCVNSRLSGLYSEDGSALHRAAVHALAGGKRVRAVLALLWCELVSGDYARAVPVAVAYELAHAAALVQDDIIDRSNMRRGEKSVVGQYGIADAMLTSNLLLFWVPRKIAEYGESGIGARPLCRLFDMLGESYGAATLGEYLDLEMAKRGEVTEAEYMEMIRLKTGALIGAASASGAIAGGCLGEDGGGGGEGVAEAAYKFGERLGMAYQVRDDLLDLMGDEGVLGKPVFTDMMRGKKNLLLTHTLGRCSDAEKRFITGLMSERESFGADEIQRARELFDRYGSVSYAKEVAAGCVDEARRILAPLKKRDAWHKIDDLCGFLSNRSY